ncbi:MAG: hypothetical protein Q8R10_12240 [Pseudomonas sp.]|uniref:DUF6160 family protein n=1 Tax=Pseudomonas sp. TaxID=306 RepID=UPI0027360031|nr:DUF6160 family protein [Pseudomonas sp.]MDP3847180.1 hypothetical protein [Pseudomonas sp.]
MICKRLVLGFLALLAGSAQAELQPLADASLSDVSGQGGVYLSGEFSINKDGGPLWSTPATTNAASWTVGERSCATKGSSTPESCGLRVAIRSEQNGGWYVLDNIKGIFSFEGLTLRTRVINSGFAGDGVGFNQDVLEFGLPNEVKFKQASFAVAVASKGEWRNNAVGAASRDATFQQTNLFSAKIDGTIRMQGNVLVFPTN